MIDLEVRRPKFDFSEDVPWLWHPGSPAFSFSMNATSMIAIGFEQMIVGAVQDARPLITDPAIEAEAMAFLRQEAQHSSTHRKHVNALIRAYPGLQATFDEMLASFDRVTATRSLEYRLAYVADTEATFTPSFKLMLDNEKSLFRPGDERVASLFLWHFVEEVEHRSSALIIYDAVVGKPWYRMRMLPAIFRHLLEVAAIIADGVNAHVPLQDRKVDARRFLPFYNMKNALRQKLPYGRRDDDPVPPAFSGVSRREKVIAVSRVLLSQTPFHNPAHEPLPTFANEWFGRWDRGEDVTRWYSAERAG